MSEPSVVSHPESGVLGVKLASLMAGFAGGVVSLSFVKELTKTQAALAVFTGATTAGYGTPVIMHYLSFPSAVENACAFFVGVTAMNIIPGVLKLSDMFKRNPVSFTSKDKGGDS